MTEIPEHLLKRAQAARDKARPRSLPRPTRARPVAEAAAPADPRIPAHLLERSRAARPSPKAATPRAVAVVWPWPRRLPAVAEVPTGRRAGRRWSRRSHPATAHRREVGSIQEVKATPVDKVHTWPHLLAIEFVAALAITRSCSSSRWFVNAPLLAAANFNQTPNPSKAPWYFLGLQELLTMFHPMIAGVTLPGSCCWRSFWRPTWTATRPTSPRIASSSRRS
jgi:menaquinol-cytochrome c reductase cytochrome b/c subunit